MPDLVTHYLFGHEFLSQIDQTFQNRIQNHIADFDLGCNGPDPFYYYHINPFASKEGKDEIYHYGNVMHGSNINAFFRNSLQYLKEHHDDATYAFLHGFYCHYFLDRSTHPYIFYMSGVNDGSKEKEIYAQYHKQFEVSLDTQLLPLKSSQTIDSFDPSSIVRMSQIDIHAVFDCLKDVMMRSYSIDLKKEILIESIHDFHQAIHLLYQFRSPLQKKIIQTIEKIAKMPPLISTALYTKQHDIYDYFNLSCQTWYHPCHPTIKRNESFLDLYENALKEMKQFHKMVHEYLDDQMKIDELLSMIENRCFDTNENPSVPMLVSDCIYERK